MRAISRYTRDYSFRSFRQGAFDWPTMPVDPYPYMPTSSGPSTRTVQFSTCLQMGNPKSEDKARIERFGPYAIAVHEAGHALGLPKFDYSNFVVLLGDQSYSVAHPTIPEAALNYDKEMPHWAPMDNREEEPDCSPHPFDVLAIYALYQNVPLRSFP